jgi:hypothetical protein
MRLNALFRVEERGANGRVPATGHNDGFTGFEVSLVLIDPPEE